MAWRTQISATQEHIWKCSNIITGSQIIIIKHLTTILLREPQCNCHRFSEETSISQYNMKERKGGCGGWGFVRRRPQRWCSLRVWWRAEMGLRFIETQPKLVRAHLSSKTNHMDKEVTEMCVRASACVSLHYCMCGV